MTNSKDILVVGAGIAGCSAAIALASAGHNVRVLEKQPVWRFQSSGIFLYSNGLAALRDLGVLDNILKTGYSIPGGVNAYFDNAGNPIVETRYPNVDDGEVPAIVGIKRAELQRVLLQRMQSLHVPVTLGAEITNLTRSDSNVTANLHDGPELSADLVIGADGVYSWVRSQIAADIQPRYSGFGVWRSVHNKPTELNQKIMMMGASKRYGIMPISADRLYTFGTVAHPKGNYIPPETWVDQMRREFAEFSGPAAPYLSELGEKSEVWFTAVEEIVMPLPWHRGRVLLIGDACHAATPFMGQGGAMAMQDGLVLAIALSLQKNVSQALSLFGKKRLPVCQFVQDVSRAVGEAGATTHVGSVADQHSSFKKTAQSSVDNFYAKLSNLNAKSEQLYR